MRRLLMVPLLVLAACGGGNGDGGGPVVPEARPNILLIVADDLGYADLGVQGSPDVLSPYIDSIASAGVRFTSGYVTSPECSPSRAALMTGRYPQRFGHENNIPNPPPPGAGLPLDEIAIADRLKSAGYATGLIGKWNLGEESAFHPLNRGFDEFFGFLRGQHSYFDWASGGTDPILDDFEPVAETTYLTEAFTREAVSFVERHKGGPFFLCLTYNAPHQPMETPPQQYMDRFPDIADPERKIYLAMLSAVDDGVGAVLDALRAAGIEEDTLVIFLSDNGGIPSVNASNNAPLRGGKTEVWEGGIRVPFMIQWKGRLPAGNIFDSPVMQTDIFTTALAAAGLTPPGDRVIDGVNLMPYFDGTDSGAPHDALFWRFGQQSAVRKANWKLVKLGSDPSQLFDLEKDIGETLDLAASEPDIVSELEAELAEWNAQLVPPLW